MENGFNLLELMDFSVNLLRREKEKIDWKFISRYVKLNKNLIFEFRDYIDWFELGESYNSEEFDNIEFIKSIVKYLRFNIIIIFMYEKDLSKEEKYELLNYLDYEKIEKLDLDMYIDDFLDMGFSRDDFRYGKMKEGYLKDYIKNIIDFSYIC